MKTLSYHPYLRYSKKLQKKIESPRNIGYFSLQDAQARGMRLVTLKKQSTESSLTFYFLVDESDGVVTDARFQVCGPSALIGSADNACEVVLRKNYDQIVRLKPDLFDKPLRDRTDIEAFPVEAREYLDFTIDAMQELYEKCSDIPLSSYMAPPVEMSEIQAGEYPNWKELSSEQKITVIEQVIEVDILPYIQMDAGGVKVLRLIEEKEVLIAYEGSCTSCHSATGATLSAIQQILRTKIYPDLVVTPDLSFLQAPDGHSQP